MRRNACTVVLVFALFGVFSGNSGKANAQTAVQAQETTGVVARVDQRANVVILDDGRMIRATPATVIMAGGSPATVASLKPGTMVVIRSGEPVALSGGQYVVVSDSPAASVPVGAIRTRILAA